MMEIEKEIERVRSEFVTNGLSVSGWAKRHGFSQALVYQILSGKRKPVRGESHRIAVALGLKKGSSGDYAKLDDVFQRKDMQ